MQVSRRCRSDGVEFSRDNPGKIGMTGIDLGVDYSDKHIIAAIDAVSLKEVQFANNVFARCLRLAWNPV
jgi:hypothetical protein